MGTRHEARKIYERRGGAKRKRSLAFAKVAAFRSDDVGRAPGWLRGLW